MRETLAYLRISRPNENIDLQRYEVEKYCIRENLKLVRVFSDSVSGTVKAEEEKELERE